MKTIILGCLIAISTITVAQTPAPNRFLIYKGGKAGFIDNTGREVIPVQYESAGNFSEGLAPARLGGYYGYIDSLGVCKIPYQFDYALPFKNNVSVVFRDSVPAILNKEGKVMLTLANGTKILEQSGGNFIIAGKSKKTGLISPQGKLLADTIYTNLTSLNDTFFITHRRVKDTNVSLAGPKRKKIITVDKKSVINTHGDVVIPEGQYKEILAYENGIFMVTFNDSVISEEDPFVAWIGFIDLKGNILSKTRNSIDFQLHNDLSEGIVSFDSTILEDTINHTDRTYQGYMDIHGNIIFNDTMVNEVFPFHDHRAIIKYSNEQYYIIDATGKLLQCGPFDKTIGEKFLNGRLSVQRGENAGYIDTSGQFITSSKYDGVTEIINEDGYYVYYTVLSDTTNENEVKDYLSPDRYKFGIANIDGREIFPPDIDDLYYDNFCNGVILCKIKDKMCYISTTGNFIWQEETDSAPKLRRINIDFMNRGYFVAHANPVHTGHGINSINTQTMKEIAPEDTFSSKKLCVLVIPSLKDTINNIYEAFTVLVINKSKKDISFNAQDNRLYMNVQAKTANGEWRDIEYLPSSWCGNSYHTLTLPQNKYWTFVTPDYEGAIPVLLRIRLTYRSTLPDNKHERYVSTRSKLVTIYSNEYRGSINPGQWWRKRDYYPSGLMDPYNE